DLQRSERLLREPRERLGAGLRHHPSSHAAPRMRAKRVILLAAALTLASAEAHAAGLYFSDRGVRPMGRAGAFVAGADDLGAIWYNPAGLADAGSSVLVDFSWLRFDTDYTRQLLVDTGGGALVKFSSPTVHGSTP